MFLYLTDILIIFVRWIHIISAVIWVGTGVLYLITIRPLEHTPNHNWNVLIKKVRSNLANIYDIAILSLTSTGAIIMLDALLKPDLSLFYISILAIKLSLVILIFTITITKNRTTKYKIPVTHKTNKFLRPFTNYTFVTLTGILIIILSDILNTISFS